MSIRMKSLIIFLIVTVSSVVNATPDIEHWQTKNGAQVYFVAAPEIPMVDIRIIFDAASARDNGQYGVALMTNGLMEEGAGNMDADKIAEAFESVGASFGLSSHRDMSVVSLRSLTQAGLLNTAVDTMATIIRNPTYPEKALERERKRLLVAIQSKKQSPGAIAGDAFFEGLYNDHPYAISASGTEDSVKKIKRKQLINHHQQYYVGNNAIVAIVGAVDKKQAMALAEKIVGQLPEGETPPPLSKVSALQKSKLIKKAFPSSQTTIQVGQPAMHRGDPDYFPLYVGNHILGGGGLVSRLSEEIREKRGLTYGTYSYFNPMREAGPFQLGLKTRNDQAEEALALLNEVLNNFIDKGPTAEELNSTKKNITGGFALNLDSNIKIVDYIAMIGFYKMPMNYLDTFTSKIDAVTIEQILEAFQRRIQPDNMVTVMVGDFAEPN